MLKRCILIGCILILGCAKEEAWKQDLIGTAQIGGSSEGYTNCLDADYGAWEDSPYKLPYPVGSGYVIGLGPCGGSYHSAGQPDMFAIDFNMPIGSVILAARSGRVVAVQESGQDGGFPNNFVVVGHPDGTFAAYAHLTYNGAAVTVGQQVAQGALLGYSGNTGLAGYPHLHLVVIDGDWNYPYTSMPVNFSNTLPNPKSLESGVRYEAF